MHSQKQLKPLNLTEIKELVNYDKTFCKKIVVRLVQGVDTYIDILIQGTVVTSRLIISSLHKYTDDHLQHSKEKCIFGVDTLFTFPSHNHHLMFIIVILIIFTILSLPIGGVDQKTRLPCSDQTLCGIKQVDWRVAVSEDGRLDSQAAQKLNL